jgi:amino acid transporter
MRVMTKMNEPKLAADSLGVGESIVMGTAGAAPAFSLSAAISTLIAAVGTLAPASILYCGLIMFGISLAFIHMNKVIVNAGASYTWVSKIFGRYLGFFAGWALLVSSAVFMVSGSIPAATATLLLIAPDHILSPGWVTFVAAIWLSLIAATTLKGIKPASYLQMLMTGIEVFILLVIVIAAIIRFASMPAHVFSLSWLSITQFTPTLFATGALTAVFLYWGWDVTLNLNEETKNASHIPGKGAFWSVMIIILLFVCFSIAVLLSLTDSEIKASETNVLFAIANKLFPKPWSYLAVLSVLLSTIGTLETSILQFTRTLFALGRDKVLHPRHAKLHQTWNSPWVATLVIWLVGMALLLLSSNFSTVALIIKDSVNSIGFQVAFYYSLTGFACAWYYRTMWQSISELFLYIIWPFTSSLFLIFIACFSIPTFDNITLLVSLGGMLFGFVPLYLNRNNSTH